MLVTITNVRKVRNTNRLNVLFTRDGANWDARMTALDQNFMTGKERGPYVLHLDEYGYIDSIRSATMKGL